MSATRATIVLYYIVAFSLLHAALFEVFTLSLHIYSEHSRRQAACGLELLLITSQTGSVALASLHPHPSPPSPPLTDPTHPHQLVTAQCPPQAGEGASYAPTAPGHNNPTVIRNCMNGLSFQRSNTKMHSAVHDLV